MTPLIEKGIIRRITGEGRDKVKMTKLMKVKREVVEKKQGKKINKKLVTSIGFISQIIRFRRYFV